MQVQTYPFKHVHQYFLDSACEVEEIDYCTALTLQLYGDRAKIGAIMDRPWAPGPEDHVTTLNGRVISLPPWSYRVQKCNELVALADRILAKLPPPIAGSLLYHAVEELPRRVRRLAEDLACWAMEDETRGGSMLPFRHRWREKNGVPFKRITRKLHSPAWIRRYVKRNDSAHGLRLHVRHTLARLAIVPIGFVVDNGGHELFEETMEQHARARRDGVDLGEETESRLQRENDELVRAFTADDQGNRLKGKALKRLKRKRRKVVRRSAMVAAAMLGASVVSAFARGEPVILDGREVSLLVHRRGRLDQRGHGALRVGVISKDRKALAELCVYLDNTPTLDQLVGFAAYANSGNEREIIEAGNITRVYPGAEDVPLIAERLMRARDEMHQRAFSILDPHHLDFTRARNRAYYGETWRLWCETLATFAGGQALAKVMR